MTYEPENETALAPVGHGTHGLGLAAQLRREALAKLPPDATEAQRASEAMHANMLAAELLNERP